MGNMAGVAVPRVIHWWWDGPPVPPEYVRFRERWAELHPGWTLQVWDEARFLAEFENHPATQLYLNRARWSPYAHEWGWKTNIARLLILQRLGGLWVDADLEPLKPVDPLIERLEASENHNALAAYEDRTHVNNAFLASPPNGPFIVALVDGLADRVRNLRGKPSNVMTGPHYLTDRTPGLMVLERALVYPMHWSELDRRGEDFPAAYTLHHWHRKSTEQTSRAGQVLRDTQLASTRSGVKPDRTKITAGPHHRPEGVPRPAVAPAAPIQRRKFHMVPPTRIRKIPGLTPESVALALADMAAQVPPDRAIVELGVYQGRTALFMAWGARQGLGAHVYAIDPWDLPGERGPYNQNPEGGRGKHRKAFTDPGTRNWARYNVRANGYANRVTLIRDFSVKAAEKWSAGPVGLLFVDGDHNYDAVRADVSAWAAHLAPDAVIAFDDYAGTHPEVIRAVDDMVNEGILEPVEVYHDRLAVTRLGSGHPDLARQDSGDGLTETEREANRQAEAARAEIQRGSDSATAAIPPAEGRPIEPAGKAETVPAAAGHHPVDDANLPLAEWAVPGELGLSQAVRLKDLSLNQLKALAKERGVVLGRDGKTRPVALAKLAEAAGGIA